MKTDKNEPDIVDLEIEKEDLLDDLLEEDFEDDFKSIQKHTEKIGEYLTYIEGLVNDLTEIELKIKTAKNKKNKKLKKLIKQWKKGDYVRVCFREVFYTGLVIRYKNEKETVILFDDDNEVTTVEDKSIEFFEA